MFTGGVGRMRALMAHLGAAPGAHEYAISFVEYAWRDFILVDVLAAGVTKGTTLARIIPYLQKRPDALWMMASIWEEPHPTRTLGTILRYQYCGRDFKLSETAPPISRYQTWGALAAAIDRSSTTFEAAPW